MLQLSKMSVRFFKYDTEDDDNLTPTITEISEQEFLETEGEIEYTRHTVFQNGVSQICLTKNNL